MKKIFKHVLPILCCFALLLSSFGIISASAYDSDSVTVGSGKTTIEKKDVSNYSKAKKIIVAEGVTEIQSRTFYGFNMQNIVLPNSLQKIGDEAIGNCDKLTEITIPKNVTSIGNSAFAQCDKLTTVYFNAIDCQNKKTKESSTNWFGTQNSIKKIVIGLKVTTIPRAAFSYCSNLKFVTIPANVKTIEDSAFYCCNNLNTVTLEEGLEHIGASAFYGCESLTEITIPNSVTYIGRDAFALCDENLKINIEDESLLEPALEPERLFGGEWGFLFVIFIILLIVLALAVIAIQIIYLVGCIKITKLYCRKKQKASGGLTVLAVFASLLCFGFWYLLIFAILNHGEKEKTV